MGARNLERGIGLGGTLGEYEFGQEGIDTHLYDELERERVRKRSLSILGFNFIGGGRSWISMVKITLHTSLAW